MTFDLFGSLIDTQRMLEAEGNLSRATLQRWLSCGFLPFSVRRNSPEAGTSVIQARVGQCM